MKSYIMGCDVANGLDSNSISVYYYDSNPISVKYISVTNSMTFSLKYTRCEKIKKIIDRI